MKTVEELFDYKTTQSELKAFFKDIQDTYINKNGYSSIPKFLYPYLYKALTYRIYDHRGKYKEEEIKTWFVGHRDGHNSIMFFDIYGNCDCLGITKAIRQWQAEKNIIWKDKFLADVLGTLRTIGNFHVNKFKSSLLLPIKDSISGEILTDIKDIHIDHYDEDFSKVAFDWMMMLKEKNEAYTNRKVDIVYLLYNCIDRETWLFKEKSTSRNFYNYLIAHTHLRAVKNTSNLSRTKTHMPWELLKQNGCYKQNYEDKEELN